MMPPFEEEKLERLLVKVTEPLAANVKELGSKLETHRIEIAGTLGEIKTDIRYLKQGQEEAWKQVDDVRQETAECEAKKNWPLLAQFLRKDEITSSIKLNKPSVAPVVASALGISKLGIISTWCIRLAPLILAAAIGLIGLGVYFASGSSDDARAVMSEIRALADKTLKMSKELKKVQEELDDGGMQ